MTKRVIFDDSVCNDVYIPYLDEMARVQIFFGGSGSGKSVFLAQRAIYDLMMGDRNYLICRQVARTLRLSVFAEVCAAISDFGVSGLFSINKSEMLITCVNGRQIAFVGLDDIEKLKSIRPAKGAWTDVWVEEATESERNSVKQLMKRQRGGDNKTKKRLTLSFNPILQSHWIYEEYFSTIGWADKQTEYKSQDNSLSILKTWYVHNRFLTPDDVRDLENETDPYFFKVYTLGEWGILGNVIFTNWRVEDLSGMANQWTNRRHGLDFGFASDPAAMPNTHYDKKKKIIYIYDELYERGLTNPQLASRVRPMIGDDRIVADSAEPKSIAELQQDRENPINVVAAEKGKDSVTHGIQFLKQHTIIIDKKCVNMQREAQSYKWKEDAGGNAIPVPVDKFNHLWDALRYAYEGDGEIIWDDVKDLGTVEDYQSRWK
jgi:phage terminase large subunit